MTSARDLTGQRFGKLTALRPTDKRQNGSVMWECRCDCGNITYVPRIELTSGQSQSCGCLSQEKADGTTGDLTGKRFGRLVALRLTENPKNKKVVWECQCDCGNIVLASRAHLVKGKIQSCGCFKKSKKKSTGRKCKNLTGERFGKLIALRPTDKRESGSVVWECQCDCGNSALVTSSNLVNGRTLSCGCLRGETIRNRIKNLADQKYEKLVTTQPTEEQINGGMPPGGTFKGEKNKSQFKDLTGKRFGKLIPLEPMGDRKKDNTLWKCQCDCGNVTFVRSLSLTSGFKQSCGCGKR